jgi:predicted enzyme related to lactoylglutathione lyase
MALVSWFEVPVVDLERAVAFYEHVFGIELERTVIDGHPMALFPEADEPGSAGGALATGDSYVPSIDGTRVYFRVEDVAATLARAIDRGAELLYPVTDVGDQGVVAEFGDTEGNRIAVVGPATR